MDIKIRSIRELLELMLKHQDKFMYGLCYWVKIMFYYNLISDDEYMVLKTYIKNNKPPIYSSLDSFYQWILDEAYYWGEGVIEPRLKWINKHIKLNG